MKLIYLLVLLLPFGLVAQSIKVIDLKVNDLIYNKNDNKIYASLPSTAGLNGNSICIIDATSGVIDTTIFIGSEPNKLALSDNGKMIYVSIDGAAAMRQFYVEKRLAGQQFTLGNDPSRGPNYVEDMEIIPGTENSVVVSRKSLGVSPRHRGVGIYDSGVLRPNVTAGHTGSNIIEIVNAGFIIGYNTESSEYGLRTMHIAPNGVIVQDIIKNMFRGFSLNMHYSKNRLYSSSGVIVDLTTGYPVLMATLSGAEGSVVVDSTAELVCFATEADYTKDAIVKRYSINNFILQDSIVVSNLFERSSFYNKVFNLISLGNEKLAFSTSNGKVVIIDVGLIGVKESKIKVDLELFPNPTTDFVTINASGLTEFSDLQLISINGEVLQKKTINQFPFSVDMSDVAPGTYFIVITSKEFSKVEKVIKQ